MATVNRLRLFSPAGGGKGHSSINEPLSSSRGRQQISPVNSLYSSSCQDYSDFSFALVAKRKSQKWLQMLFSSTTGSFHTGKEFNITYKCFNSPDSFKKERHLQDSLREIQVGGKVTKRAQNIHSKLLLLQN